MVYRKESEQEGIRNQIEVSPDSPEGGDSRVEFLRADLRCPILRWHALKQVYTNNPLDEFDLIFHSNSYSKESTTTTWQGKDRVQGTEVL
jgi:hypothetical protein